MPCLFDPKLATSNFRALGPGIATGNPVPVPLCTNKKASHCETFLLEGQVGLEPTTPCLKGRCSNRLSYWPGKKLTPYIIQIYREKSINPSGLVLNFLGPSWDIIQPHVSEDGVGEPANCNTANNIQWQMNTQIHT
jgi:hypothetical protein